ncbi:hypothetical protein [Leucobacter sp. OH1287]|uniref:hypothetical protein n=1 Tax=Leucobacter sp. OH1287 TaxID=2491049 RepID=UPI000F5E8E55|nr:hypothetical protein [Leucobacter sp. OH1287]RRD61373.1 hypothetical protein EII30_02955 [Leucobacter sp. OH1287]
MKEVIAVNRLEYAGKTYEGGETLSVEPGEARDLINLGKALPVAASEDQPTTKAKKESANKNG